eukprot:COSAG02_NODE_36936_length_448_cov_1.446991_1_plen_97_part_10
MKSTRPNSRQRARAHCGTHAVGEQLYTREYRQTREMRKFSRSWVALALLAVADRSFAAPHPDEECCWCGKPYIRDRSAQTTALDALESSQTSEDGGS